MLRKLMWVFLVAVLLCPAGLNQAAAQDGGIAFTTYVNENAGITAPVPEGWAESTGGVFSRYDNAAYLEVTMLPPVPLAELMVQYTGSLGIESFPEPSESVTTVHTTWDIYSFTGTPPSIGEALAVLVGIAETEAGTMWVGLYTSPDEAAEMRELVFDPVLEGTRPLAADEYSPVPYEREIVAIPSVEGVVLSGTLTLPGTSGPHPAVVLISGSGASDRDESLMPAAELKPFYLIADYLTREGIAVLRYDDRGVGQSSGNHVAATSADFADDAGAVVAYLQTRDDINPAQVGVLGHSEGGLIAAMLAARDPNVAFVISLAGPTVSGTEILLLQNELILAAMGLPPSMIEDELANLQTSIDYVLADDRAGLEAFIGDLIDEQAPGLPADQREQLIATQVETVFNPWMKFFYAYDPGPDWAQVTVPVLAFFGGLDLQVDAQQNAGPLENAMAEANNADVRILYLENANHLFQAAKTGAPSEYGELAQEFVPELLPEIGGWLLEHVEIAQ